MAEVRREPDAAGRQAQEVAFDPLHGCGGGILGDLVTAPDFADRERLHTIFNQLKTRRRRRRKLRIRKRLMGIPEKPRLTVFRSHKNIYCQVIDDSQGKTLTSASTREKGLRSELKTGGNRDAAAQIGKMVAERIKALGIQRLQFDRNGYRFHGRVKALVEAAREAGLKI